MAAMITPVVKGMRHDFRIARVWPVEPRHRQLGRLRLVRLQLLQAADRARLALLWSIQRVPGGTVHRDVRLSAHYLLPFRLAAEPLSRCGLVLSRRRTSA